MQKDETLALPAPMVPAEIDLREFTYMPLSVGMLRDSAFATEVSAEAFRAGVMLWAAAWHQVPASSLPTSDKQLAKLAGYGFGVDAWLAVKAEAMYKFELCSDGRFYHPVIAQKAIEAWKSKLEQAYNRMTDRVRKRNKLRAAHGLPALNVQPFELWNATGRQDPVDPETLTIPPELTQQSCRTDAMADGEPAEPEQTSGDIPPENALKGREGKGREGTKESKSKTLSGKPDRVNGEELAQMTETGADLAGAVPPAPPINAKGRDHESRLNRRRQYRAIAVAILSFLNEKAERRFPPTETNVGFVVARLEEGFSERELRQVVAKKTREWKGGERAEYLRPETLFNKTKFSSYVGELVPDEAGASGEGEP